MTLTNPQLAIETFGMTALEAMAAGLPVIVPTKGGIAELVKNGENGFRTDVQQLDVIEDQLRLMLSDENLYRKMSATALICSQEYNCERTEIRIEQIIQNDENE